MIQFILDNKEWIFSGIGVVIILGTIRIILNRKKRHQSIIAGNHSTNIQARDASIVTISTNGQTERSRKPTKISSKGGVIRTTCIHEGDFQEFIWGGTTVKIAICKIVRKKFYFSTLHGEKEANGAVVDISVGGGLVYGGEDCKRNDVNKYLIPQRHFQDQESCSVYYYNITRYYFRFFRLFVDHVNPHSRQVTLNIFFADIQDIKGT